MAFCDALLWSQLVQSATSAIKGQERYMGKEDERKAAAGLVEADGLGEAWKSIALSASWSFWKDLTKPHNKVGMKTQDFAKHLQETGHFKTIAALDDIWQARTKNLRMFSNLRIFRDPIKPLWEVPQNREGGKFVLILNKPEHTAEPSPTKSCETASKSPSHTHEVDSDDEDGSSQVQSSKSGTGTEKPSAEVPLEYKLCLSLMVLGLLGPVDQFCGCVLSIRAFGHMISIWVSTASDTALIDHIKSNISAYVGIPYESISFQRHNESIRNNTRNLSKTETRRRMREARAKGDLVETPSKPPRRKSESEKPVWGSSLPETVKSANNESTTSTQPYASAESSNLTTSPQYPSGIGRSLSGGKLQVSTGLVMPPLGNVQPYQHPNQHPSHQGFSPRGGFVSPRSGQAHPPTSPRGSQTTPSTPSDHASSTSRHEPPHSEPTKGGKTTGAKRGTPVPRAEKVHFQENVSVQTISRGQAVQSRGVVGAGGRGHGISIPDIHILTGTPPPSASPISLQLSSSPDVSSSIAQDNDEASWIPAGSKAHHRNTSQQPSQPARREPRGSTSSEGAAAASSYLSSSPSTSTTASKNGDNFGTKKRRTQSVGATGQRKPDPNYVSPEALFGADLPLLSPSGTPHPSVPPSPPAELDEDDLAFLTLEKSKQQHNVAQAVADKLSMGPLSPRMPSHSSPRSSTSSTQEESLSTSSSGSPGHTIQHQHQHHQNDSQRRRNRNKRRKSTTDSTTADYNGSASHSSNGGAGIANDGTVRTSQTGARSASTSSHAPPVVYATVSHH